MAIKEGIFLCNNLHVNTDSFGDYPKQAPVVGFYNYGNEGKFYYSFDEVEELLKNGFIDDNIGRRKDGELYLKSQYCSYCEAFKIVCGQVVNEITEKQRGIYDYCKKIGLVKDIFIPIKGWFGTKEMSKNNDDTYDIYYTFNEFDKDFNLELAEEICVGKIKRLAEERRKCYGDNHELIISKVFKCKNIFFDKENKKLIIKQVPLKYVTGDIIDAIVSLDLELWMLFNKNKHWSRFFDVAEAVVRDMGQSHWFRGLKPEDCDKDKERNISWYNRKLGEIWD